MAASIVTESNQHLLETGDGHDRMGRELIGAESPLMLARLLGRSARVRLKTTALSTCMWLALLAYTTGCLTNWIPILSSNSSTSSTPLSFL
jgi:hypothetical protein